MPWKKFEAQEIERGAKHYHLYQEAGSHAGGNGCKVQFYMAENGSSPPENRKHSRTGNRNRTNSESGTSITSSSSSYTLKAPDGGWGWVVVAAAFFVNMIADGVTFSFTYLFQVHALVNEYCIGWLDIGWLNN